MPKLSLVAALDDNGLIGRAGALPWRLPDDLRHFRRLTLGKTVLMGRRTWESLGRALPGRDNWVLTRDAAYRAPGARVFASLDCALAAAPREAELMVIGGAELYRQTLPLARRLYLTRVHAQLQGDTWFPAFDPADFELIERQDHAADGRHAHAYSFLTLERRASPARAGCAKTVHCSPSEEPMSDLTAQFEQAQQDVTRLSKRPGNDDLLALYSLYKQAIEGDVKGARPGMLDMVGRAKYDAWARLKGTPPDEAKRRYVAKVQELQKKLG